MNKLNLTQIKQALNDYRKQGGYSDNEIFLDNEILSCYRLTLESNSNKFNVKLLNSFLMCSSNY